MIKRFFTTAPKPPTMNIGDILKKCNEAFGITPGMTLEEKYEKLIAAQKSGKIPGHMNILSPKDSTLKQCLDVVSNTSELTTGTSSEVPPGKSRN